MKKLFFSLFLVISFSFSFAQKANVSKAKNKALMENPDFAGAREAIKLALQDPTTQNDANTTYVAGLIGNKENDVLYQKVLLNMPFDADVKGQAIMESYAYFIKTIALDALPNEKGKIKPRFTKDIKAKIKEYYTTPQNLIAYGAHLFEKKNYVEAIKTFEVFMEIPKLSIMNNEIPMDSTYNMIKYYTAVAATNSKNHEKAIGLFTDLKDDNYETVLVYQLLYEEYKSINDTVNYVKVLKEGVSKFPSQAWFLQNLINHLIYSGKTSEALEYLVKAIESEPTMAQYRFVKGNLDESLGNLDAARASFDKAIELDPTMAESYSGIGRLYYNKAVKMLEEANNIKDVKLYNLETKKAEKVFMESVPFFKKAAELKPAEIEYKNLLKTLYYRLKMDKEYEAINKEIENM